MIPITHFAVFAPEISTAGSSLPTKAFNNIHRCPLYAGIHGFLYGLIWTDFVKYFLTTFFCGGDLLAGGREESLEKTDEVGFFDDVSL